MAKPLECGGLTPLFQLFILSLSALLLAERAIAKRCQGTALQRLRSDFPYRLFKSALKPSRPQTRARAGINDARPPDARQHQEDVTTSGASISEAGVWQIESKLVHATLIQIRGIIHEFTRKRHELFSCDFRVLLHVMRMQRFSSCANLGWVNLEHLPFALRRPALHGKILVQRWFFFKAANERPRSKLRGIRIVRVVQFLSHPAL